MLSRQHRAGAQQGRREQPVDGARRRSCSRRAPAARAAARAGDRGRPVHAQQARPPAEALGAGSGAGRPCRRRRGRRSRRARCRRASARASRRGRRAASRRRRGRRTRPRGGGETRTARRGAGSACWKPCWAIASPARRRSPSQSTISRRALADRVQVAGGDHEQRDAVDAVVVEPVADHRAALERRRLDAVQGDRDRAGRSATVASNLAPVRFPSPLRFL